MKKALIIVLCFMLIFPNNLNFTATRYYIEDMVNFTNNALDVVKPLISINKYNTNIPQNNDVANLNLELGIGEQTENVGEYVEWKLKRDNTLINEDKLSVVAVSDILYKVNIRSGDEILRHDYTAIRLTIKYQDAGIVNYNDVLWIGPFSFLNYSDEFIGNKGVYTEGMTTHLWYTTLYYYRGNDFLIPFVDGKNSADKLENYVHGVKFPKRITQSNITFLQSWDEWTGG